MTTALILVFGIMFNGGLSAQPLPGDKSWAEIPESQRHHATAPVNARSSVRTVRHALLGADRSGARGYDIDADTEALRGTFRLMIPLMDAPGRTSPLRVSLHYQARIWFGGLEANMPTLDGDQEHAPGWSLGLPKILGGILIEGDGSRHAARRTEVIGNGQNDVDVTYLTTDGSDITYRIRLTPTSTGAIDPNSAHAVVYYPNGSMTVMRGQAGSNSLGGTSVLYTRLYATEMVDSSGNVTTIEYESFGSPTSPARAIRIVDPLGRQVKFHYTAANHLSAITGPALNGGQRVLARLIYQPIPAYREIDPTDPQRDKFNPPTRGGFPVIPWTITTGLKGIYFPGTASGYWFGDPDTYNLYGMITKVIEQVGMKHQAASLNEEGILTAGTTIRTRVYDYPYAPSSTGDRQGYPRYKTMTETILGREAPIVTHYETAEQMGSSIVSVKLPDGTRRTTTIETETGLPLSRTILNVDTSVLSAEEYIWEPGSDGIKKLTQLVQTDQNGRKQRMEYTFNAQGRLQEEKTFDWVDKEHVTSAPLLRWMHYEYVNDVDYSKRGIRGLIRRIEIYSSASLLPEERTDYEYDSLPLRPTPNIGRNLFETPGFRSDLRPLMPTNAYSKRGLLTKTVSWVNPQIAGNTATIDTEIMYTAAGAVAETKVGGKKRSSNEYSAATEYAFADSVTLGSVIPGATEKTTSVSTFKWDVGTGRLIAFHRPSMGAHQTTSGRHEDARTTFEYDDAMRLRRTKRPGLFEFERTYSPAGTSYTDINYDSNLKEIRNIVTEVDGLGSPTRITITPSGFSPRESRFVYDDRGRLTRFTRDQTPGTSPQWTTLQYDSLGRVTHTVFADGSSSSSDYGRAFSPPMNTLAIGTLQHETDPWKRERFIVSDALGRTIQLLEPPSSGGSWASTRYQYDARSNLISIYSDLNEAGSLAGGRRFQYDGLSRLTHRYLIERSPALNAFGKKSTSGIWSDFYSYNDQSQLVEHVDPRGVSTTYDYKDDPLGRVFSIIVKNPPSNASEPPILPVPTTVFSYMNSGDPMRVRHVAMKGVYSEDYEYDRFSSLESITTTFIGQDSTPVRQRVTRGTSNRMATYGVSTPNEGEVLLKYAYDSAGRNHTVSGAGAGNWDVTAIFDERGPIRELRYTRPSWQAIEAFTLHPATTRLSNQSLFVNQTPIMNNEYIYERTFQSNVSNTPMVGHSLVVESVDKSSSGQLVTINDQIAGMSYEYGYDQLARLTGVLHKNTLSMRKIISGYQYKYDLAGNRIDAGGITIAPVLHDSSTTITPVATELDEDAADGQRHLQFDALTNHIINNGFAYDMAGNIVRLPRKNGTLLLLAYDGLGRLARVQKDGTFEVETYTYNHRNQLIKIRRANNSTRYSVWSGDANVTHFEASNATSKMQFAETLVMLGGRLVARLYGLPSSSMPEFVHSTPNGMVVTGPNISARSPKLRPYGFDPGPASLTTPIHLYHSYERNYFGLDYAINRHYDPETGRFLQPDRMGQETYRINDPQSLNLYSFTRADPINRRDPLGLEDCSDYVTFDCANSPVQNTFETVVRAKGNDAQRYVDVWYKNIERMYPPWPFPQMTSTKSEDLESEKESEEQEREKQAECNKARSAFAAAANAYARVGSEIYIHNLEMEALKYQAVEFSADIMENYFEQQEDFSKKQATAAAIGRSAAARSMALQIEAGKAKQANLLRDRQTSLDALKSAAAARDAACN